MRIEIVDVGSRDGLQNEDGTLSPEVRAALCDRLAGVPRVKAASFVNPKLVPRMAGAEEVMSAISYAGLALNEKGYERAIEAGVDEVRYAFPVTETFAERGARHRRKGRSRETRRASPRRHHRGGGAQPGA